MANLIQRYVVPSLVIQAVLVGGGYATGRELVEFFLSLGPLSGLAGMLLTALIFSMCSMISFELARRYRTFDYGSFTGLFLGRFRFLFEISYLAGLMLALAVVSAAAGELLLASLGWSRWFSLMLFMAVVAGLVFFGNTVIERVISAWSVVFYLTYAALFLVVLTRFGDAMVAGIAAEPFHPGATLWSGLSYAAYNIPILPVLIFVARNFQSRREALISGALAGPLILLPGFAFLLALSAFYPTITTSTLPIQAVLQHIGSPLLSGAIQLVILGALVKTGAGLLHGFNERLARHAADRTRALPNVLRPLVALTLMLVAVIAAAEIGLVDLIGKGYRYSALIHLFVLVIPLLTIGLWRLRTNEAA
jgi:uncharacterized membrane protein YkvI